MTTATSLPPRFDALDPAVLADPYPTYERLRAAGPICRGGPGTWMVTRYAEVAALLSDHRLVNQLPAEEQPLSTFGLGPSGTLSKRIISSLEPPGHTRLRTVMAAAFAPSLVRGLRPRLVELVDELLGGLVEQGQFDVIEDLAFPLQARVVCELLGIPLADRERIWPIAMQIGRGFIPYAVPTPQQMAAADEVVTSLREYMTGLLDARGSSWTSPADTVDRMRALCETDPSVSRDDVVDNLIFLCFAGFETTMSLLGTAFVALLDHPEQWARLRADRTLIPTAVEEFLRFDAPAQYTIRLTREAVDIGDRTVRKGRMLLLMLGSANRDERRFDRPDRLDVGRHPNPHVSFGGGIHHCLGWALARVEGEAMLYALLDRVRELGAGGAVQRLPQANFRAYRRVPVAVTARPRNQPWEACG